MWGPSSPPTSPPTSCPPLPPPVRQQTPSSSSSGAAHRCRNHQNTILIASFSHSYFRHSVTLHLARDRAEEVCHRPPEVVVRLPKIELRPAQGVSLFANTAHLTGVFPSTAMGVGDMKSTSLPWTLTLEGLEVLSSASVLETGHCRVLSLPVVR
jgi:hypothetical protein